ncbi:hypothetical protein GQ457_12G012190 [Hibiscus cannabinus]
MKALRFVNGYLLSLEKGKKSIVNLVEILSGEAKVVDIRSSSAQDSTTTEAMSQSIDKPPYFNDGPSIAMKRVGELHVPKERHEWSNQERKQKEGRNRVKVEDLKPKRIKDYLEYKFSQKTLPSRVTVYKQAEQLFGLRHKPITLQDALPRYDPSRDNLPRPDPLSLAETSPLSSMQLNAKGMHILICALGPKEHAKVSSCDNAKEIWDKLEVIHVGTNETSKLCSTGSPNELKGFGEAIQEDKLVEKLIYSLLQSWNSKKTNISKNLKELKFDEFIGSLLNHELMSKPLTRKKEKKIKEQGINVNDIALKSSKCQYEDSSMEESSEKKMRRWSTSSRTSPDSCRVKKRNPSMN